MHGIVAFMLMLAHCPLQRGCQQKAPIEWRVKCYRAKQYRNTLAKEILRGDLRKLFRICEINSSIYYWFLCCEPRTEPVPVIKVWRCASDRNKLHCAIWIVFGWRLLWIRFAVSFDIFISINQTLKAHQTTESIPLKMSILTQFHSGILCGVNWNLVTVGYPVSQTQNPI